MHYTSEFHKSGPMSSGRSKTYSVTHLQKLWHIMGRICSKKMVAALPTWLKYYQHKDFSEEIKQELISMSSASIDRWEQFGAWSIIDYI